ncbi:Gti1/Pac2 family-domain-containing protein [Lipomyces tetrasporus]|uniref:Gti1/Pac2 family-domain-containing protein n=1 Tax=Lipomyces tetrasporus TaxID=54092 RepID=A0AAD7VSM7_9ASCO|nr:Gti1/Pac2 family-domain-containing protein [Lipomyces tetrasporus]KAJ8100493.1 Gti1/Pac2 family-domain-containing protein [Lipomyces tetrasporus]
MTTMETYYGHVRTPFDAIILFEACRLGILPRVQRRLSEKERMAIRSGSVFVWDEREAGMRRWTDGKSWSASRVSGSFLTYREMEGKRGGGTYGGPLVPSPSRRGDNDDEERSDSDRGDDGPDGYRYKPDGLMKQSFSIQTSSHLKLHLISYYSRSQVHHGQDLMQPSHDPALKFIRIPKGMYPDATSGEAEAMSMSITPQPQPTPLFTHHQHPSMAYQQPLGPPHMSPIPHHQQAYAMQQQQQHQYASQLQLPVHHQPPLPHAPMHQVPPPPPQSLHVPQQPPPVSQLPSILSRAPQTPQQPAPQQIVQPLAHQQYGWPPSPASTPPNYSLHSMSAMAQAQSQSRPQHQPQQMTLNSPAPSLVAKSLESGLPALHTLPQQPHQPLLPHQQIPRHMQTGERPFSAASLRADGMSRDSLEVQDIPFDKVSWGEDVRAIKELNKTFII